MTPTISGAVAVLLTLGTAPLSSQYPTGQHYSPNVKLISHLPLAGVMKVSDLEVEQELTRPYAYVSRGPDPIGFDLISIKDPARPRRIYQWVIENPELHNGRGVNGKYFKLRGRYYYVQAVQIRDDSPGRDIATIIFDVTGVPDTSQIREVGRIRTPQVPGGAHNLFTYKHSDGRTLLFNSVRATPTYPHSAHIYDLEKFLAGEKDYGFIGGIPIPEPRAGEPGNGYHDEYVAYHPPSRQDRFYGGGPEWSKFGGNFVFNVTDPANPKLLVSVIAQASMESGGHTFVATPDGRYGLTVTTSWAHQPLRIWDLQPALEGKVQVIKQPVGEFTVAPGKVPHMIEVRWPYAFVADYEQGLRILDIRNPSDPMQVGFYDTYNYRIPFEPTGTAFGAYGLDVRNADGLIVVADDYSGFWTFRMDGFDGWNGHDWGMPNISSVQDWDNGPDGAPKPAGVS